MQSRIYRKGHKHVTPLQKRYDETLRISKHRIAHYPNPTTGLPSVLVICRKIHVN